MSSTSDTSPVAKRPTWAMVYAAGVPFLRQALRLLGVAEDDLEDVLQDVLLAAYRGLDRYDVSRYARAPPEGDSDPARLVPLEGLRTRRAWSPLFAWLFGIAWRQVSHHRERAHRRREIPVGLHDAAVFAGIDRSPSLEQHVAAAERAQLMGSLLTTMEPPRRVILVMHDMLEVAVADIARELGINENTAQNRLRLAREDFRAATKRLPAEKRSLFCLEGRPFAGEPRTRSR